MRVYRSIRPKNDKRSKQQLYEIERNQSHNFLHSIPLFLRENYMVGMRDFFLHYQYAVRIARLVCSTTTRPEL